MLRKGGKTIMDLDFIKAFIVNVAILAVWYGVEWIQYGNLQWDRWCDNVVWVLYLLVLWYLFAKQN